MKTFILHGEIAFESPCDGRHILITAETKEAAWTKAQTHLFPKNKTRRSLYANYELDEVEVWIR